MAAELVVSAPAEADMDAAYEWYEARRRGLGEEFMTSIDACFEAICRWPESHQAVRANFRRAVLRRFPYAVFYGYADDVVTIYCVFHTSRDSEGWRERLT